MDYAQALTLSFVEGITEFLPISSTGHLILTSDLLKILQTDFVKSFEVIIQLGAILAVVVLYFKKFLEISLWPKILAAFLPTAILGLIFYKIIKTYLLGNSIVVLIALFVGGLILILLEKFYQKEKQHLKDLSQLSLKRSFLIGIFQSVSMVPGVSRSAASIIGGIVTGLNRKTAVEFSFLIAVPTMVGATGLDLIKSNFNFTSSEYQLLAVGLIGSFITAILAIKFFIKYVQNHTFIGFAVYRIVLALVFWLIFLK